jgi:hypothetical protein
MMSLEALVVFPAKHRRAIFPYVDVWVVLEMMNMKLKNSDILMNISFKARFRCYGDSPLLVYLV